MGLFSKETCEFCGAEVGALKRSKTADQSYICKDCKRECSVYFKNYKRRTDREIKNHIDYMKKSQETFDHVFQHGGAMTTMIRPSQVKIVADFINQLFYIDPPGKMKKAYREVFPFNVIVNAQIDRDTYIDEDDDDEDEPVTRRTRSTTMQGGYTQGYGPGYGPGYQQGMNMNMNPDAVLDNLGIRLFIRNPWYSDIYIPIRSTDTKDPREIHEAEQEGQRILQLIYSMQQAAGTAPQQGYGPSGIQGAFQGRPGFGGPQGYGPGGYPPSSAMQGGTPQQNGYPPSGQPGFNRPEETRETRNYGGNPQPKSENKPKFCPNCGAPSGEGNFCENCGTKL